MSNQKAKTTTIYKYSDSFVSGHANNYKYLRELHNEIQIERIKDSLVNLTVYLREESFNNPDLPPDSINSIQWAKNVINWFNDWIRNGPTRKDSQLYLWGASTLGKTKLINHLLFSCLKYSDNLLGSSDYDEKRYELQVFSPTPNEQKYAWESYDKDIHRVVLIDEFDVN